jgi:hypothetical protein
MTHSLDSINLQLPLLGANIYDMMLPEVHALSGQLHPEENLLGVVFGKYETFGVQVSKGRGALIATDQRIMLLDKKPLFIKCDEIIYSVVSGITFSWVVIAGTVLLHTRMGEIKLHTYNHAAANHFIEAVESMGPHTD